MKRPIISSMKRLIISILFLFIISEANSKNDGTKLDSLLLIVNDLNLSDSLRFYAYDEISRIYALSNPRKAIEYSNMGYEISKKIKDTLAQGIALRQIGAMNLRLNEISDALDYHLQALELFKKIGNEIKYAEVLQEIGVDYVYLGEYNKASSFMKRAIETFTKTKSEQRLSACINNLGGVYYYLEQYDSALVYYQKAVEISLEINDEKNLSYAYHNIGEIHLINENYIEAKEYIKKSLKLKRELGNLAMIPNTLISFGEIEMELEKYESAFKYLIEALSIGKEIESKNNIRDSYKCLVKLEEKRGRYSEALKYHKEVLNIEKEIQEDLKNKYVSKLQVEFETTEVENENIFLKEKAVIQEKLLRNQKIVSISVVIILIMFIVLAWQFFYNLREQKSKNLELLKKNAVIKNQSEKLTEKNIKLNELNSTKDKFFSIIGHDLKSPFNAILGFAHLLKNNFSELSEEQKTEFVSHIFDSSNNAFELLSNLLEWSQTQRGSIKYEPETILLDTGVTKTIEVLHGQARNKNIDILVEGKLNNVYADPNMLLSILRNLISNSIKYSNSGSKIIIKSKVIDSRNHISIIDQGVGISKEDISKLFRIDVNYSTVGTDNEKGTGLGLILCKEFVEQNKGEIHIESTLGKGTKFVVILPTELQNKIE